MSTIPASRLFEKMMTTDPEFRREYEAIGPAYDAMWARIDATRCNVLHDHPPGTADTSK